MENLKKLESTVLDYYKKIEADIKDIESTNSGLTQMHVKLVDNKGKINEVDSYDFYVDNIYFHKNILEHMSYHMITIKNMSFRKLYGDLFKLYAKITKKIHQYDNVLTGVEKKDYLERYFIEPKIKRFDVLTITNKYYFTDMENILKNIRATFESLKTTITNLTIEIETKNKLDIDGYIANTHIIGLISLKNKLNIYLITFMKLNVLLLEKQAKFLKSFADYSNFIIHELKKNFSHDNTVGTPDFNEVEHN